MEVGTTRWGKPPRPERQTVRPALASPAYLAAREPISLSSCSMSEPEDAGHTTRPDVWSPYMESRTPPEAEYTPASTHGNPAGLHGRKYAPPPPYATGAIPYSHASRVSELERLRDELYVERTRLNDLLERTEMTLADVRRARYPP